MTCRGMSYRVHFMLTLCCVLAAAASEPLPPFALKCEGNLVGLSAPGELFKRQPFATDVPNPRFSWATEHTSRSARQTAYQVLVSEDWDFTGVVWDTGVLAGESNSAKYGGEPLRSGTLYLWKVKWWDQHGDSRQSLETGHFLTGALRGDQDWSNASWITAPTDFSNIGVPVFSKKFNVDASEVAKSVVFFSGLSFGRLLVNSHDIYTETDPPIALNPGWTNYEVRVPYSTFDVTSFMKESDSAAIDVLVGIGWRNSTVYKLEDPPPPRPDSVARVLKLSLQVTYKNGTNVTVVSDDTWTCTQSPVVYDSIYNGETYNAASVPGKEYPAEITPGPNGVLYLPDIPYIAEMGTEKPVRIYKYENSQIVDFGFNSAGVCAIDIPAGATVQMHHAEVPMHPPYGNMNGSLYYANLRDAKQLDTITTTTSSMLYQPRFTYHGFRYVQVSGYPTSLTSNDIQKVLYHSAVAMNGKFNSSIPLLNAIQENIVRGHLSNLMSVPTDCDQRSERLGWMGDAGLSSDSMALNFDMESFLANFVQLIADEQLSGSVPDVVPFYLGGRRPSDPSWGDAFPHITYVLYKYYNSTDIAEKYFPALMNYVKYMVSQIPSSGIGKLYGYYGDWCPPPPKQKAGNSFVSAFSLLMSVKTVKYIATSLGYHSEAAELDQILSVQEKAFNEAFLVDDTYEKGLQINYVLPLALDIVPDNVKDDLTKKFLNQLTNASEDNSHITAGIIGTKYLFPVLTNLSQHEIALDIVQKTDYPSWGYMIHNTLEPATTVWELWDAPKEPATMNSRNHHMFSSVSAWLRTSLVGVEFPAETRGFEMINLYPARQLGLSHASVSFEHPKHLQFSWERNGGIQCGKAHEDQSPLNLGLPKHDGLILSCGREGVIHEVLFASFGNPTGRCGYRKIGNCHAIDSREVVEKICVGKRSCVIPTGAEFWGSSICPMTESKWLIADVQCKSNEIHYKYSSLVVNVHVPVGSKALVFLPAHGKKDLKVMEGEELFWSKKQIVKPVEGILFSQWLLSSDELRLELDSGSFEFTVTGDSPKRRCLQSERNASTLTLTCGNSSEVVTSIDWASYGTPVTNEGKCFSHSVGKCGAGCSLMTVQKSCVGKTECTIPTTSKFFGSYECPNTAPDELFLLVEYTCAASN